MNISYKDFMCVPSSQEIISNLEVQRKKLEECLVGLEHVVEVVSVCVDKTCCNRVTLLEGI